MIRVNRFLAWTAALVMGLTSAGAARADDALRAAIASTQRAPAAVARDAARHPYETLSFFGIRPDMTVVELSPGGGWYTEILAPYLKPRGQLILAGDDPESTVGYYRRSAERMDKKLKADPAHFDRVRVAVFAPPAHAVHPQSLPSTHRRHGPGPPLPGPPAWLQRMPGSA